MTNTQPTFAEQSMQLAEQLAQLWQLTPEQTADAVSYAWEFAQRGNGTPSTVAYYALRRVKTGFRNSVRSIDGPPSRTGQQKPKRVGFNLAEYASDESDPAEAAAFRMDFTDWQADLNHRHRAIADALASGDRTEEVAERFAVSAGRVSQIRRELETSYEVRFAE